MTADRSRPARSSTSRRRPSRSSGRSARASSTSASPGSPLGTGIEASDEAAAEASQGLGAGAIRELARRYGVRPNKSLGQHFLIDPNLARAIATDSGASPHDRVIEVGAGFGSLTVALAATGAQVVAIEFDRAIVPALREVTDPIGRVEVREQDVMRADWGELLGEGSAPWILCANLPYNIAVPLVADVLKEVPRVRRLVVMVQREVGERLAAGAGDPHYGAVSVRVAYRATTRLVRRVPSTVFWPKPNVDSVVVRLDRREHPAVAVDEATLWRVVDGAFGERRKTMRNALRRFGLERPEAEAVLAAAGVSASTRPETLGLTEFAAIVEALPA